MYDISLLLEKFRRSLTFFLNKFPLHMSFNSKKNPVHHLRLWQKLFPRFSDSIKPSVSLLIVALSEISCFCISDFGINMLRVACLP